MGQAAAVLTKDGRLRLDGVLTAEDLGPYFDELASRLQETDEFFLESATGRTDANGNAQIKCMQVPAGFHATLHVVVVEAAGYTPQAAFSQAGAGVNLVRTHGESGTTQTQGGLVDFTTSTTGVLPCIFSYGGDRRWLRSSERLVAEIVAGPATTDVTITTQGVYRPVITP